MYGVSSSDGRPYRVLIIDDSAFMVKQLSKILTSGGFEVVGTASDGAMGVGMYMDKYREIDLVTMDITMPRIDGISALKKIMSFNKQARVVMVTALGHEELVKQAIGIGAKGFIVKPLDRNKVLERINAVLSNFG